MRAAHGARAARIGGRRGELWWRLSWRIKQPRGLFWQIARAEAFSATM